MQQSLDCTIQADTLVHTLELHTCQEDTLQQQQQKTTLVSVLTHAARHILPAMLSLQAAKPCQLSMLQQQQFNGCTNQAGTLGHTLELRPSQGDTLQQQQTAAEITLVIASIHAAK
jgi:hypothetical protein